MDHITLLEHLEDGVGWNLAEFGICPIASCTAGSKICPSASISWTACLSEGSEDLAVHQLDAIEDSLDLGSGVLRPVLEGALQIIDRRKEILDEILVAVA